jgi:hypothetical protein
MITSIFVKKRTKSRARIVGFRSRIRAGVSGVTWVDLRAG